MIGYSIILAVLVFIAIVARIIRRMIKRHNYGFPVSRNRRRETYMSWSCGKD
ncbi:MAG: hypothetical protein LBJ41_01745 [Treponema sp.]|nr:hypothetical protein [Treponema sp.]